MKNLWRAELHVLYLLGTLALNGCGRVGPIRPPESVAPKAPTELSVMNAAEGLQIRFRRPTETVDGMDMRDLGYLELWRTCLPRMPRVRIARFPVIDRGTMRKATWSEITDSLPADGETCHYEIIAETTDGYRSATIRSEPVVRRWRAPAAPIEPTAP